uniref:NADH-ubiquinone oxidoreductase chain 6 n=1 Tax=Cephalodiscus hodgsoni TaxID=560606 RepID=A0A481P7X8_9BILA|nr:NADH dehydrogenase subunit 6 [Cephalodiscus hodgsoni]
MVGYVGYNLWGFIIFVGCSLMVIGSVLVWSSLAPFFSVLSMVVVVVGGLIIMVVLDNLFFSMVVFLVYLGGMVVVFVYSSAMAADRFPLWFFKFGIELLGVGLIIGLLGALWGVYGWGASYPGGAGILYGVVFWGGGGGAGGFEL